jgi:hypothetical protein
VNTGLGSLGSNQELIASLGLNPTDLITDFGSESQLILAPIEGGEANGKREAWLKLYSDDDNTVLRLARGVLDPNFVFHGKDNPLSDAQRYVVWESVTAPGPSKPNVLEIKPPINAEFLFYLFLPSQKCDALVGDLEERYKLIHKKFGARHANFWYWSMAIRSVWPIFWAWTKKAMKAATGLTALVELYKRIRQ